MSRLAKAFVLFVSLIWMGMWGGNAYAVACTSVAAGGNWNATTTWAGSCVGGNGTPANTPGSADTVTIAATGTVTLTANAAANSITVNAATAANGITLNGFTLNVTNAVVMTATSTNNITSTFGVGTGTLTAASITINGGTGQRASLMTVSTGTITTTGDISFAGTAANARLTSTGASMINIGGNLGSGGTLTTGGTGTINFNGAGAQSIGIYTTYNNVTINKSAGTATLLGNTSMTGALTITSGTFANSTFALNVAGNFTQNDTFTAGTGVVTLNGGAAVQTISGAGPLGFANLTINNTGGITLARNVTVTSAILGPAHTLTSTCPTDWTLTSNGGATVEHSCPAGPDHAELVHDGSALTCTPKAITVLGCTTSASCNGVPANQYVGNFSITPTAIASAQWCSDSVCATPIAGAITISSGTLIYLKDTNVRTDRMAGSAVATNTTVQCTNTATPAFNATTACDVAFGASGFLVSLPSHVSCTNSTLTVQAVQANNNATNCVPMFMNRTRNETVSFAYSNPATGTLVPTVGGTAISTAGASVSLSFNNSGIATPTFVYQDVGKLSVTVTDPTLPMTGSTTTLPIIAPQSFSISNVTAGPVKAGNNFSATITAMNFLGTATPNFGKEASPESATVTFTKCQPTGTNAVNGTFSGSVGSFNNGAASATNLNWSEAGDGDLVATLTSGSYLGSGLTATGNTGTGGTACNGAGNVGSFIPDHFITTVTDGCMGCGFTYSGQPFTVTVTAMNGLATPTTTFNYDGTINTSPNFANNVTLSDANAAASPVGVLMVSSSPMGVTVNAVTPATTPPSTTLSIPKVDFIQGAATLTAVPIYTFNTSPTAPTTIKIRAVDAVNASVTSSGFTEGTTEIRSGRVKISNAHGSELLPLPMTATVQYWNGTNWLTSLADSVTSLTLGLSNYQCKTGCAWTTTPTPASGQVIAGALSFKLSKPTGGGTGSVDVNISAPNYLLTGSNGAAVNPSIAGRATFGVYKGNNDFIYLRENY